VVVNFSEEAVAEKLSSYNELITAVVHGNNLETAAKLPTTEQIHFKMR